MTTVLSIAWWPAWLSWAAVCALAVVVSWVAHLTRTTQRKDQQ